MFNQRFRLPALLASLVLTAGCAEQLSGPTPTLSSTVTPSSVCNASDTENTALQTRVVFTAQGDAGAFAPLPVNLLTMDAGIELPGVTLVAMDGTRVPVFQVEFISNTVMALWVTRTTSSGNPLPAGLYSITVTNPHGASATTTC